MKNQKAIMIITAIVNKANIAELTTYLEKIQPIFAKNGAKPIARYKTVHNIAGTDSPEIVSIFEFNSSETVNSMVESDEFTGLSELRERVFSKLNLIICAS
jgi:uncharacterized protein (DUF1330 family)